MIELVEVYGNVVGARAVARDLEARGYTVLSTAPGLHGQGGFLITAREPATYRPLGSDLQKGLRLATAWLLLDGREVDGKFSSLVALAEGRQSPRDMDVIESALARLGK